MNMNIHLDLAQQLMGDALALDVNLEDTFIRPVFFRKVDLARVQAEIAQANALERIAVSLEAASLGPNYGLWVRVVE